MATKWMVSAWPTKSGSWRITWERGPNTAENEEKALNYLRLAIAEIEEQRATERQEREAGDGG